MKRIATVLSTLALLSVAACGGSGKSCDDAVNAVNACVTSLGGTNQLTVDECNSGQCSDKQGAIDCLAGLACGTDLTAYQTASTACLTSHGCNVN